MMMRLATFAFAVGLFTVAGTAAADDKTNLHIRTDVVQWDQPLTEAQCVDKGKSAVNSAFSGMTAIAAQHAYVATKPNWVLSIDCLQSYKANIAYVTVVFYGSATADYNKVTAGLSKALGGSSETYK